MAVYKLAPVYKLHFLASSGISYDDPMDRKKATFPGWDVYGS